MPSVVMNTPGTGGNTGANNREGASRVVVSGIASAIVSVSVSVIFCDIDDTGADADADADAEGGGEGGVVVDSPLVIAAKILKPSEDKTRPPSFSLSN